MRCGLKTGFHLCLSARTDIPFVLFTQIKWMRGFVQYIILSYTGQNQFVLKICSHVGENIRGRDGREIQVQVNYHTLRITCLFMFA